MSNRYPPPPPDEPIIGGGYAPRDVYEADDEPVIGATSAPAATRTGVIGAGADWDDGYDDEYGEDEYYEDGEEPARNPLIYVAIVGTLVVLVGAVFLAMALISGDNPETVLESGINVGIDAPAQGERVETGKVLSVVAQAASNDAIVKFELLVDGRVVSDFTVAAPVAGVIERATLQHTFTERGDHELRIRATSDAGATKDSEPVSILVIEPVTDSPVEIEGRVVAAVNARVGPGQHFDAVGSLPAGEIVTITGKTRNLDWLLVDSSVGDDVWVPANSIEPLDALALVNVREPTPTRPPATEVPTQGPTEEPTPDDSLPDLAPAGAVLVEGGASLQVTILNTGGGSYSGPIVVSVSGITGGTLTQAFQVSIPANGSTSVNLDVPPIDEQKSARVTVDPDDAIDEGAEDNNSVTFTVNPLEEEPNIVIGTVAVGGGSLTVTVLNNGGDMDSSVVTVRFSVTDGGQTTTAETSGTVALAKNQGQTFTILNAPSGTGVVTVLVDGVQVASTNASVP